MVSRRPWLWRAFAAITLLLLAPSNHAAAQTPPAQTPPDVTEQPTPAVVSDLEIRIRSVGPGGGARAGSWAGVLVRVQERAATPREIVLRLSLRDEDGDTAYYDRVVATNTGIQSFWLYAPLPFEGSDSLVVSAYAALEIAPETATDPMTARLGARVGDLLARDTARMNAERPWKQLIGVVGSRDMGLKQYAFTVGQQGDLSPLWHGVTTVASGLGIDDLPDRWQGYAAFDVLVWGATRNDFDPQLLAGSPAKASAIEAWVRRGGHLVVVWPAIGNAWASEASNPLVPLLPRTRVPTRREGVDLEPLR
ncbi:MAG: hypothetical protein AAF235_10000, partial [Planctomycetota bacterium]